MRWWEGCALNRSLLSVDCCMTDDLKCVDVRALGMSSAKN